MTVEDLTTFSSVGKHIQYGIVGYPPNISSTSNEIIFYGCNNGSSYHCKDKGIPGFEDFVHFIDIIQNTGENEAIVFPWMLSNDLGDAKTLKDSLKNWVAIKVWTDAGSHKLCIEECNNGILYDSPFFAHGSTPRYLKIISLGTFIGIMIYNSSDDRSTNTNVQGIISRTLKQSYSFRYIFLGNTWFTNPNDTKIIKITLNNFEPDRPIIILDDDFPSQAGWETYATSGSPKIQFMLSPSQVRFYPTSGTVSGIASGLTKLPLFTPYPLPSKVTIEFKFKVINSFNMCSFMIRTNASNKYIGFTVSSTKIQLDNISYNLSHSLNTWYTYRLIIDADGNSCKVYRKIGDGSFGSLIKNFTPLIVSSGNFFDLSFFAVISGSEAYLEYVKIIPGTIIP